MSFACFGGCLFSSLEPEVSLHAWLFSLLPFIFFSSPCFIVLFRNCLHFSTLEIESSVTAGLLLSLCSFLILLFFYIGMAEFCASILCSLVFVFLFHSLCKKHNQIFCPLCVR